MNQRQLDLCTVTKWNWYKYKSPWAYRPAIGCHLTMSVNSVKISLQIHADFVTQICADETMMEILYNLANLKRNNLRICLNLRRID
jgi:hypothetical protein